jgi:predicted ester cyclase
MSEENKALSWHFFEEVWNNKNVDVIDEIMAADYVGHSIPPQLPPNRDGLRQFVNIYLVAFPNTKFRLDDQIAEGDKVVTRWTAVGKHEGELMGIPATGKEATVTGITIDRHAGGKIVESEFEFDAMGLMIQIGAVPPPGE